NTAITHVKHCKNTDHQKQAAKVDGILSRAASDLEYARLLLFEAIERHEDRSGVVGQIGQRQQSDLHPALPFDPAFTFALNGWLAAAQTDQIAQLGQCQLNHGHNKAEYLLMTGFRNIRQYSIKPRLSEGFQRTNSRLLQQPLF